MNTREIQNVLKKFGFSKVREGKHSIWQRNHPTHGTMLVPVQHLNGTLNIGIIGKYARMAQINTFKLKEGAACRYSRQDYENDLQP